MGLVIGYTTNTFGLLQMPERPERVEISQVELHPAATVIAEDSGMQLIRTEGPQKSYYIVAPIHGWRLIDARSDESAKEIMREYVEHGARIIKREI